MPSWVALDHGTLDGGLDDTAPSLWARSGPGEATDRGVWHAELAYGGRTHSRARRGRPYLQLAGRDHLERTRFGYRVVPVNTAGGPTLDLFARLDGLDRVDDQSTAPDVAGGLTLSWRW